MTDPTRAPSQSLPPSPIGESVPRLDGVAKVTGAARFTVDLDVPGMAHAWLHRSPYAHARIVRIDTTAAAALPGVITVVSAADLDGVALRYGHAVADHPLIAVDRVRFVGEPVVGVVAEDLATAVEAVALVEVEYEPLPVVADVDAALAAGAPLIHEVAGEQRRHRGFEEDIERPGPNVCSSSRQAWGDAETALEGAHLVLDDEYRWPMCYAYAMEPYAAIASFDGPGSLTVWTSAQHPYMVQEDLAGCFGLPLAAVRVVVPYVGGGYGSKSYTKIEPLVAALALRARRPVRLALGLDEAILTTRGDSARVRIRTGFDPDGRILARAATILLDSGAYAENSPLVARKAANRLSGPYRIGAVHVVARSIYTNTAPASSFRGFGAPQVTFAAESQLDDAAARLGIDPLELRRRNVLRKGEPAWPGVRPIDADLPADLDLLAQGLGWDSAPDGRALGMAISASDAGADPVTTALVRVHADGSMTVSCGSTEMGQGSSTVLAQIAAGEMGLGLDRVRLTQSDTGSITYDRSTGASRTTTLMGLAIQRACRDARDQLLEWASDSLDQGNAGVTEVADGVDVAGVRHDWGEVVRAWFGGASGEVIGRGYVRRAGALEQLPPFWEIGCVGVEVDLDRETGRITVTRLVTVGDVGRAINPRMVEGQDMGAATMGLGMALTEELVFEDGNPLNANLFDYRVPRASDTPAFTTILAERGDGVGPYGAKGGGEGALNPVAAAIGNAVFRATGTRLRQAPFTPERVWRALRDAEREA